MQRMLFICLSIILFIIPQTAHASEAVQTTPHHPQAAPQATCSGYGCDGTDPSATGCTDDAYTVRTAFIENGYVWLRFSPSCKTNWTTTHSDMGRTSVMAKITRESDGRTYTRKGVSSSITSLQVYVGDILANACGKVGRGAQGCTGFFLARNR